MPTKDDATPRDGSNSSQREGVLIHLRVVPNVDLLLRKRTSRRGVLSELMAGALSQVDLRTVPIIDAVASSGVGCTSVRLARTKHTEAKAIAERRDVSMNTLLNSVLWQHLNSLGPVK